MITTNVCCVELFKGRFNKSFNIVYLKYICNLFIIPRMPTTILGTWSFSYEAVSIARDTPLQNYSIIDSIEKGINCIEENPKYGPCVVGVGGPRNSKGYLEMDAAIMDGREMKFGAVTALKGFSNPISVARAVMNHCPHNMLTSEGAKIFAENHGFSADPKLAECKTDSGSSNQKHDTLGLIAFNEDNIACGVSTSGMPGKLPGRVGDSALPGNGLYADCDGGAACCSGDGDFILQFCPAFRVVHCMKNGKSPNEACATVIKEIKQRAQKEFEISIIAVNMKGEYGSGTTVQKSVDPFNSEIVYNGFPYVVWTDSMDTPICLSQEPAGT